MIPSQDFAALTAWLEQQSKFRGKRLADIPKLAQIRVIARRRFYRLAEAGFALTIFNVILATAPAFGLQPLSAIAGGLSLTVMLLCECTAWTMTRQLHRRAAVQIARDMLGIRG
jgi:hypothetical protein